MAENQRLSESDTIILSLHDRWWEKILAGEKTLEIRKTRPAAEGSFRVLVYVTGTGTIQGEFTCNHFWKIRTIPEPQKRAGISESINVQQESSLTEKELKEYAGDSGKPLWGWSVSGAKEFYTPHPLSLYGLKRPPQSWQYYRGKEVPDIMPINDLANICGYFFNANFDIKAKCCPNNGYNCRHPEQKASCGGVGCCYQWSCPLQNVCPADEEDCEKYGLDYEENEFVLVYRQKGGQKVEC